MKRRAGFTLIELVVIIMILGILAGVAAPKLLKTSGNATDNGLKQSLAIVRDAIELYSADNGGTLPGCTGTGADFRAALCPLYIRGTFPLSPVGSKTFDVTPVTGATTTGDAAPTAGWKYNTSNGTFICNYSAASTSQPTVTYDKF
jgi:general secretion pathway protein G